MAVIKNEEGRIKNLLGYNLDYSALEENFTNLSRIAALSTNSPVAVISLIDADTQWVIGGYGIDFGQYPRDTSICQFTIEQEHSLELNESEQQKYFPDYMAQSGFKYYYGVSIESEEHFNIGTLCIIDVDNKQLQPMQKEILNLLSREVSRELSKCKHIEELSGALSKAQITKRKLVHDVRSPLQGIMGVAELFKDPNVKTLEESRRAMDMIYRSSSSLLDLSTEILEADSIIKPDEGKNLPGTTNIKELAERLQKLFLPKAISKKIELNININEGIATIPFLKGKILQIGSNLISNALKFTPADGLVQLFFDLKIADDKKQLIIQVQDNGVGIHPELVEAVLNGQAQSTAGTTGEKGFGFGLAFTNQLISAMNGKLEVQTKYPAPGTIFSTSLEV